MRKEVLMLMKSTLDIKKSNERRKRVNEIESDLVKHHSFLKNFFDLIVGSLEYVKQSTEKISNEEDLLSLIGICNDKVSEVNKKVEVLSQNLLEEVKLNEMKVLVEQVDSSSKEMVNSLKYSS